MPKNHQEITIFKLERVIIRNIFKPISIEFWLFPLIGEWWLNSTQLELSRRRCWISFFQIKISVKRQNKIFKISSALGVLFTFQNCRPYWAENFKDSGEFHFCPGERVILHMLCHPILIKKEEDNYGIFCWPVRKFYPPPQRMYAFSRNSFNYLSKRKKYSSIRGNTTKTWDFIVVVRCIFWVNYFKLKKFDNPTWWKNNATLTYVSCKHQRIATSLFLTSVITTQWTPKRPILRWLWGWHALTNDAFH